MMFVPFLQEKIYIFRFRKKNNKLLAVPFFVGLPDFWEPKPAKTKVLDELLVNSQSKISHIASGCCDLLVFCGNPRFFFSEPVGPIEI